MEPAPVEPVFAVVCSDGHIHWDAFNMVSMYKDVAKARRAQLDDPQPSDHKDCEPQLPAACGPHRLVKFSGRVITR